MNHLSSADWNWLREALARLEHERWAHWQEYLHSRCQPTDGGGLLIPPELVERWKRQIDTPYDQLSETEKESDREQVERVVLALQNLLGGKD